MMLARVVVVVPSRVTWMLRLELEIKGPRQYSLARMAPGLKPTMEEERAPAAVLPRKSPTHKNQNLPSEPKLKSEIAREKGAKKQDTHICGCSNDGTEFVCISEELVATETSRALPLAGTDGSCFEKLG